MLSELPVLEWCMSVMGEEPTMSSGNADVAEQAGEQEEIRPD